MDHRDDDDEDNEQGPHCPCLWRRQVNVQSLKCTPAKICWMLKRVGPRTPQNNCWSLPKPLTFRLHECAETIHRVPKPVNNPVRSAPRHAGYSNAGSRQFMAAATSNSNNNNNDDVTIPVTLSQYRFKLSRSSIAAVMLVRMPAAGSLATIVTVCTSATTARISGFQGLNIHVE